MMRISLLMALMLISGCATVPSDSAVCDGTAMLRTAHAAALANISDAQAKQSGAALIGTIDAGCAM